MTRGNKRPLPVTAGALEPERINAKLNASIHNRFDIEVIDSRTGEVRQRAQAENIILNSIWPKLLVTSSGSLYWNYYIHYGSGTGTLSASRTSLFNYTGSVYSTVDAQSLDHSVYSLRKKAVLSETTAIGTTITEIGIAASATSNALCTHAMLKDMNGNSISITKTETDIINIYATVFVHFNSTGHSGIKFQPHYGLDTAYGYPTGFCAFLAFGRWSDRYGGGAYPPTYMVFSASNHLGVASKNYVSVSPAINIETKTLTLTAGRVGAAVANDNNSKLALLLASRTDGSGASFYLPVGGEWCPGFNITGEPIGVGDGETREFKTKFPKISNVNLYLNGTKTSDGVTIDENMPFMIKGKSSVVHTSEMLNSLRIDNDGELFYYPGMLASGYIHLSNDVRVFENPYFDVLGFQSFFFGNTNTCMSNDGKVWTELSVPANTTFLVPEAFKHYRYVKVEAIGISQRVEITLEDAPEYNIHFDVAPAAGAVITADYMTKSIPKDENHVFDFSLEIQLGEYTPA